MKFEETTLKGAYLIHPQPHTDERGFFARFFCAEEFASHGLETKFMQANNSLSLRKGTLRGLHYQLEPAAEVKLVRCVRGAFFDVIVDLRPTSPTFGKWFGDVLSADNRAMMYVPRGFAHGFLTLTDEAEVIYMVSHSYSKRLERGLRWNDETFNIAWPAIPSIISERDAQHPDFDPLYHLQPQYTV